MSAVPHHDDVSTRAPRPPDPAIDTVPLPVTRPVFVDPSGRRRRVVRRLAAVGCGLLGGYGVVMATALLGAPLPQSVLLPPPAPPSAQGSPVQAPPPADGSTAPHAAAVVALPASTAAPTPAASAPAAAPTTTSVPPGLTRRKGGTPPSKNH